MGSAVRDGPSPGRGPYRQTGHKRCGIGGIGYPRLWHDADGDGEVVVSKFLRALQKVGLVEGNDEAESMPEPVMETAPESVAPEPPAAPALPVPTGPVVEQRPFEAIYAEQSVAASPFPAEKLLKILDGLAALEPTSRKAAVLALDAADDSWTIDDSLLDAERKVRALAAARGQLEAQARQALEQARDDIAARETRQQDAVTKVRAQIAELEALLEREVTRATEEKAALESAARSTKEACVREAARLDTEALRLKRVAEMFGSHGHGVTSAPP
jgi:hypothetical protein